MAITDDGCGFDVDKLLAEQGLRGSYGLLSMEDRVKLAGGRMELESSPGTGTTLRFFVPTRAGCDR
jgi:two-component system sensor histidine kinase DegS